GSATAKSHHAVGVFTAQPAGPAQAAGIARTQAQLVNIVRPQMQAHVVVQRGTQHETNQHAQRLVVTAWWQKVVKTCPIKIENVNAKLAAAITYPFTERQAVTERAVAQAQLAALISGNVHFALHALLDVQLLMLEVVTQ